MRISRGTAFLLAMIAAAPAFAAELKPVRPDYKREQILVDSAKLEAAGEMAYLAFPDLVWVDKEHILVSYKRGRSHALDPGAVLEAIRFNTRTESVVWRRVLGGEEGLIYQMGEWIEFPSGRIGSFADVQRVVKDRGANHHHRTGSYCAGRTTWPHTFSRWRTAPSTRGIRLYL